MIGSQATEETVDRVFAAYVECALWSSIDDDGTPLDDEHGVDDITSGALTEMREEVADFLDLAWRKGLDLTAIEPEQLGHDFWLTRNHHGAGFWDRGLGELGDALTDIAESYGSSDLYVGDDGAIYVL